MSRRRSSPSRRIEKAVTPAPSITSSTIETVADATLQMDQVPSAGESIASPSSEEAYLRLISQGASPAAAAKSLGIPLSQIAELIEADECFRARCERTQHLLSQNVAAALYRSAMEGSVSAQTFYLKSLPPPEWSENAFPSREELEKMTDAEFVHVCLAAGMEVPNADPLGKNAPGEPPAPDPSPE